MYLLHFWTSQVVIVIKNLPASAGDACSISEQDPQEEDMATHSSILAWRIPQTEKSGGLQSIHGVAKSRIWLKQLSMHTLCF